jgi:hypothetical protein
MTAPSNRVSSATLAATGDLLLNSECRRSSLRLHYFDVGMPVLMDRAVDQLKTASETLAAHFTQFGAHTACTLPKSLLDTMCDRKLRLPHRMQDMLALPEYGVEEYVEPGSLDL